MKRLSVALIAVGLSAPALANNSVYVPSQKGGFKIAIDPLYLRKNDVTNLGESVYDWGTYAQIGYLFPATGNDLTVDYTYLRTGDKESMDLDASNIEIGQRLTTGAFDVRLFTGVRYAHLNYALDASTPEAKQSLTNLFHGFGPRMGADVRYQLGNCSCLGLDTHINASFLMGTVSTSAQNDLIGISSSMKRIVPELDAKLGVDYTYPIPGGNKSALVVEVGYQTNNYFNAFNTDLVGGTGDANFDGVYLEAKYYA
jgi:hypothetical protein